MYEGFTGSVRKLLTSANQEALRQGREELGTGDILTALLLDGKSSAARILTDLDITLDKVYDHVKATGEVTPAVAAGELPHSPILKKVLEAAIEETRTMNHNDAGTDHLLLAMTRFPDAKAAQIFVQLGVPLKTIQQAVYKKLGYISLDGKSARFL